MSNGLPAAARHLTYNGNVEANLGSFRGPNMLGEMLMIVSREYNPDTDKTVVGFAYTGRVVPNWMMGQK